LEKINLKNNNGNLKMCPVLNRLLREINELKSVGKIPLTWNLWKNTIEQTYPLMKHDGDRRYYRYQPNQYILEVAKQHFPEYKFELWKEAPSCEAEVYLIFERIKDY
jgi:hypothetical protein